MNAFYDTFSTVFRWVLIPLPLGLFCIVAYHMSRADTEMLKALATYVGGFWIAGLAVFVVYVVVLAIACRMKPWRPLIALKTPLILAFATDNPFVALKSAIDSLRQEFKVPREVADTVVPFGVLANQHGQIVLFTFTAVFLGQIYDIDMNLATIVALALGVAISGAAAVGGGAVLAPILAPVLIGAGIPDALLLVIFATTQPAVANLGSTLTVKATCVLAILSAHGHTPRPTVDHGKQQPAAEAD